MRKEYWVAIAAVVKCLIAGLVLSLLLQPKKPWLRSDGGYEAVARAYQAGGAGCQPAALGRLTDRKRQAKADACAEAEEQHRSAGNTLIEYRRQADAANAGAVLTYEQTRIAAWSLVLSFFTFAAAGFAAWYARQAAGHNRRAADATESAVSVARDANSDTRMLAAKDARPWIVINVGLSTDITFDIDNVSCLISINTKNIGKTPAYNVVITARPMFSSTGRYDSRQPVDDWTKEAMATLHGRKDGFTLLPGEDEPSDIIGYAWRKDWPPLQGPQPAACIGIFTCVMYQYGEQRDVAVHSGEYWIGLPKGPIQVDVGAGVIVAAKKACMIRGWSGKST